MDGSTFCPKCGVQRPARSPDGPCPDCMLCEGLDSEDLRLSQSEDVGATMSFDPGSLGETVLEKLAVSIGPVPRVHLRDAARDEEPSALVRPAHSEISGTRLARLQLFGEIARGGMGAVLKGRDPDLGRDLAVKVLLEKHHDNPDLIRRFIEEAQIAGQLQHPGIVPVYELGSSSDCRPYFSMKLVRGRTLAELLAERESSGRNGSPPLTGKTPDLPRFLSIFEAICQTMAYAHARGVIHRDLKPSNVMVGAFGEVQVMDWGLAKVLPRGGVVDDAAAGKIDQPDTVIATGRSGGDSDHSQSGSIMGTPAYMAPEQARGETERIDERVDVFALGSILCEVMTGRPAFVGRTSGEILRMAAKGDLSDAIQRLDACIADSDLIRLAKSCLQSEREARLRSAGNVAQEMGAYLAGVQDRLRKAELQKVEAQARAEEEVKLRVLSNQLAAEAQARVIEERKRHRVTLALAVTILALALLGGGGSFWIMQERQALVTKVDLALNEADVRREQARLASGDLNLWTSAREAARRATSLLGDKGSAELGRRTRDLVARIEVESEAARRDRRLIDALADVRAARIDRGLATTDLAYATALAEYQIDINQTEADVAARSFLSRPGTFAVDVATALDDWSVVRRGRMKAAADWAQPLDLARAIDPDPYRDQIRSTLKQADLRPHQEVLRQLAADNHADELPPDSAVLLARALAGAGDIEAAVALLRKSTERHPDDLWVNFELASLLLDLRPAQPDEAIRYFTAARALRPTTAHTLAHILGDRGRAAEAIAVFQDLERRQPEDGAHAGCLGNALKELGRTEEARNAFERAIIAYRSSISAHPDEPNHLHNLGIALRGLGRSDEAIETFRAALQLQPSLAQTQSALGVLLNDAGRSAEAEAAYREALRFEPDLLTARANLASVLQYQGRLEEAIAEFRTLVARQPHLAILHYNLGNALWAHKELEQAAAEQREALRLDPDYILARINLGCILCDSGSTDEGIASLREAARRRPEHPNILNNLGKALSQKKDLDALRELARQNPGIASPQIHLGKALFECGRYDEALGPLGEAVTLDPESDWALTMLGICQAKANRHDQAVDTLRRAAKRSPDDPAVFLNLGSAHYGRREHDEAIIAFRESLRLRPDDAHAHASLANALYVKGDLAGAATAYNEAIRLDPTEAGHRYWLGRALEQSNANGEAVLAYREAIRLRPDFPGAREHLGVVLYKNGDAEESLTVYREAIRLHPERADGHYGLGTIEMLVGQIDEATASFREAVRLDPNHPEAHCNLGQALKNRGFFAEALGHFRQGHELGSNRADWKYPSAEWVNDCEKFVEVDQFLSEVLNGKSQPQDNSQRFALGLVAHLKGHYAASARFYSDAISADPDSVVDPSVSSLRYRAACSAVLAGCGRGKDDSPPGDAEKATLRSQARDWLRSELKSWDRIAMALGLEKRQFAANTIAHWKKDAELAMIREETALAILPEAERKEWQAFWAEVDQLLEKIGHP